MLKQIMNYVTADKDINMNPIVFKSEPDPSGNQDEYDWFGHLPTIDNVYAES
jgi:hypothetical protein